MSDWDDRFSALLRERLPELSEGDALGPDTDLPEAGLDSVQLIELIMALEAEYGVTFTDEHFAGDTFTTAGSVWQAVQVLRGEKV